MGIDGTRVRLALGAAGAGIAYYFLTALSLHFRVGPDDISFVWPPTAFVLALLCRIERRAWLWYVAAMVAASILANAMTGRRIDVVLMFMLIDIGVPTIGAVFLRPLLNQDEPLSTRGELLALGAVGSAVTIVAATAGMGVLAYMGHHHDVLMEWRIWASSTLMGIVILAPLMLAATVRRVRQFSVRRRIEAVCILSLLAVISWTLFQAQFMPGIAARVAVYASMPILLLSGFRTGVLGSAISIAIVGTVGTWQLSTGGQLPGSDESAILDQAEWAETYFSIVAISTLVLAVLFEEFQSALRDRKTQNTVLERIVAGEPPSVALNELVRAIEANSPGMIGSVLVLEPDGKTLRVAAGPGLPPQYNQMVDGIQVGPVAGSCGTAVFRRERVVVSDVRTDPLWVPFLSLANRFGLQSCWSQPILGARGQILGTFAMYYGQPRSPTRSDLRLIESAAHLAGIALERYRMINALNERGRAYASLVSNLSGMVYRCGIDDEIWSFELLSDFAATLTGYTPEDFTTRAAVKWDMLVHPEDLPANRQAILKALTDRTAIHLEYRITTRQGREKWVWDQAHGVYDDNGKPVAIEGIVTDITARKLAEQAAQEARRVAEQANRTKDQFLAMLSHELRTPLTPVLLYASSMERDRSLNEEHRREVRVIRQQVELESRLIDDLLDVTRIQRGKFFVSRRATDLAEVIEKVVESQKPLAAEKKITLTVELWAASHQLNADPARMQQLVSNLLSNAIKFTPAKGSVLIRTSDSISPEGRLFLEVMDTGIGIHPEILPRLFVPFEQGRRVNSPQFGGLGLGLTIVKAIAEVHDGSVRVSSLGENRGTNVTVELPLPPVPLREQQPDPLEVEPQKPLKILLVEDDPPTRAALQSVLSMAGHTTATADTLAAALEHIRGDQLDLMISDIQLPDGDGLTLMRQLRVLKPVVRGIALSGFGTDEDVDRSRQAGFREHLVKPIDGQSLADAIRRTTLAS